MCIRDRPWGCPFVLRKIWRGGTNITHLNQSVGFSMWMILLLFEATHRRSFSVSLDHQRMFTRTMLTKESSSPCKEKWMASWCFWVYWCLEGPVVAFTTQSSESWHMLNAIYIVTQIIIPSRSVPWYRHWLTIESWHLLNAVYIVTQITIPGRSMPWYRHWLIWLSVYVSLSVLWWGA